jgi:phospholipase/lecithinase/hemolysin
MILGGDESPPPSRRSSQRVDPSGVNFAMAGSGVLDGALRSQVEQMASPVSRGLVDAEDLQESVALVAASAGHDYDGRVTYESSSSQMRAVSGQVTDEIAGAVVRLQELGVGKILVNLMPALGCLPWNSADSNYSQCDDRANTLASIHNSALSIKLESYPQSVLLLDLYSIVQSNAGPPCCSNSDPDGYCGQDQDGGSGRPQYTVCDNPDSVFFWDYIHPSQAGWETIMEQLEGRIEDFLGIESSW